MTRILDPDSLSIVFTFLDFPDYISSLQVSCFWNKVGKSPASRSKLSLSISPFKDNERLYFNNPSFVEQLAPTTQQLSIFSSLTLSCGIYSAYVHLMDSLPKIRLWDRLLCRVELPLKVGLGYEYVKIASTEGIISSDTSLCPKLAALIRSWFLDFHRWLPISSLKHIVFKGLFISKTTWLALAESSSLESITLHHCSKDDGSVKSDLKDMIAPFVNNPRLRTFTIEGCYWRELQLLVTELLRRNLVKTLSLKLHAAVELAYALQESGALAECTSLKKISLSGYLTKKDWLGTLLFEIPKSKSLEEVNVMSRLIPIEIFEVPTLRKVLIGRELCPSRVVHMKVESLLIEEIELSSCMESRDILSLLNRYRFENLKRLKIGFLTFKRAFLRLLKGDDPLPSLPSLRHLTIDISFIIRREDVDLLFDVLKQNPLLKLDLVMMTSIHDKYKDRIAKLVKEIAKLNVLRSITMISV
jgi:hypothetical protein